jgi:hypothetical protein
MHFVTREGDSTLICHVSTASIHVGIVRHITARASPHEGMHEVADPAYT